MKSYSQYSQDLVVLELLKFKQNEVNYKTVCMLFEVVTHIDAHMVKDIGSRCLYIAGEINKMFDQEYYQVLYPQKLVSMGIGMPKKFATNFYGNII